MKILGIKIKNLASLEGESEIDFTIEPLKSAGIFAITGPMGAGKSTLLDALCLALFAKTPRNLNAKEAEVKLIDVGTDTIAQGDVRSILSKGCADGYAIVSFTGIDGNNHQAKWSVKRARNQIQGSLQKDTIELFNTTTNTPFPDNRKTEVLPEIERLVGLNYEQFTRSVLLAQGEFTAFLKASKDQKSSLLEKLTGTDIYSAISMGIYAEYKEAEEKYQLLQIKMEGIELLSDEEIKNLNDQKILLISNILRLDIENSQLVDDMNWHKTLEVLTLKKAEAETTLVSFKNNKDTAKERINLFNLVENVQNARDLFSTLNNLHTQLENTKVAIKALLESIETLNINHATATLKLDNAEVILLLSETNYQEAAPQIAAGKVLDTLIKEKKDQANISRKDADEANNNNELHLSQITRKKDAIIILSNKIEGLKEWKQTNEARKPIAENLTLIISKLADAGIEFKQEAALVAAIDKNNQQVIKFNESIDVLKKEVVDKEQAVFKINTNREATNLQISVIPINEIKKSENILNKAIDEIVPAISCWEMLYTNEQDQNTIEEKIKNNLQDSTTKKDNLQLQSTNLQHAQIKYGEAEKILNKALLHTQQNVEEMRAGLTEGIPCPVCGSEHHPFSIGNPILDNIMDSLKHEALLCKEQQNTLWINCNKLTISIDQLTVDLTALEIDKVAREIKINELNIRWQGFAIYEVCKPIAANEKLSWLKNEERQLRNKLKTTQQKVTEFENLKQTLDEHRSNMQICEKEGAIAKEKFNEKVQQADNLNKDIKHQTTELIACNQKMTDLTNQLNIYFTDKEWRNKWLKDPLDFIQKINLFSTNWNEKVKALDTDNSALQTLNTELNGLQNQLKSLTVIRDACTDKHDGLQLTLNDLQQQRKYLFNGEQIDIAEQTFQTQIVSGKKIVKQCLAEKEIYNTGLITENSHLVQKEFEQEQSCEKITIANQRVSNWIEQYNLDNKVQVNKIKVAELLAYPTLWITEERQFLNSLDQGIIKATATFEERNLYLIEHATHDTPKQNPDDLATRFAEVRAQIDITQTEGTANTLKLLQQKNNLTKVTGLIAEIEIKKTIFENWQKLNDLIGSADGKKFRQFAQEYTLDILLGFSNIHLQDFAHRYSLSRVPGTLALQVEDKDMGDEVRSVHSLSGGESFLVSLALALGLSSLSSNKMKVESLFIDEGFGSLDPATLIIAMDALGKLQGLGRKVGVISHVQEMTENITTQIRISKVANGRSKVEVV